MERLRAPEIELEMAARHAAVAETLPTIADPSDIDAAVGAATRALPERGRRRRGRPRSD